MCFSSKVRIVTKWAAIHANICPATKHDEHWSSSLPTFSFLPLSCFPLSTNTHLIGYLSLLASVCRWPEARKQRSSSTRRWLPWTCLPCNYYHEKSAIMCINDLEPFCFEQQHPTFCSLSSLLSLFPPPSSSCSFHRWEKHLLSRKSWKNGLETRPRGVLVFYDQLICIFLHELSRRTFGSVHSFALSSVTENTF